MIRKILILIPIVVFSAFALGGPNASGGVQITESEKAKLKIRAILDEVSEPNEVLEGILEDPDSRGQIYMVKIRTGNSCSWSYYRVTLTQNNDSANSPVQKPKYQAKFLDLIYGGSCRN